MIPKVLLLEDEVNVGSTLRDRLELESFKITWALNVKDANKSLSCETFTLAILDVQLPDGSGFDVARTLRSQHPETAIIFLTAANSPEDRIHGLELGAEDYIPKPFHTRELLLRIQNVLKRAQFVQNTPKNENAVIIGKAEIRFSQYELISDGEKHHLSHKECALLKLLYEKRGQVVSRDDILNMIWSEDEYPTPRTIDNFILRLRKLVEPDIHVPSIIRSVRGVGYLMERS